MEVLSKWLQGNSTLIIIMFIVTLISSIGGIISLIVGWKRFYRDYLSKPVKLPVWILILGAIGIFILASFRRIPPDDGPIELSVVQDKQFGVQQVTLDGRKFQRCKFYGTELIFKGRDAFSLEGCVFDGQSFVFAENAALTLGVLSKMYADMEMRPLIENIIQNISTGVFPLRVLPTDIK